MALQTDQSSHWLSLYASKLHEWHSVKTFQGQFYYRRQGIVENLFDIDGTDFEGRADLNIDIEIEIKTVLDHAQLRHKILLAWAYMRHQHVLMSSKSQYLSQIPNQRASQKWINKCFVYRSPLDAGDMILGATQSITFVEDEYPDVDHEEFYLHLMNTSRVIDETLHLSKLFVMPLRPSAEGKLHLRVVLVACHQIADGLTCFRWSDHFIRILNWKQYELQTAIQSLCSERNDHRLRLPPAQESIYPPLANNVPLLRWKWLITRTLRHVQKTLPSAFENPLGRDVPRNGADDLPHTFSRVLGYERKPPLNCFSIVVELGQRATHNLVRLSREAGISIGSGCFTLVGLVMMKFEELRNPDIALQNRLPFVGSFPVNPRPFLSGTPTTGKEDSLMLAFSEGVTLPFLPSHLDLSKRFRVVGRLAHRQLRQYQKRRRSAEEEIQLGMRNPSLLLPLLYLSTMERLDGRVKPDQSIGFNPQGDYPLNKRFSMATCGISSVGDRTNLLAAGQHDLDHLGDKDLAADFRDIRSCVRARDGEFLVGAMGTKDSLHFIVSYDGSALDPVKVKQWGSMMKAILDKDMRTPSDDASTNRSKL